jgi:hypothetical protein
MHFLTYWVLLINSGILWSKKIRNQFQSC